MEKVKRLNFDYELELYQIPHNSIKMNSRLDHFIPWYAGPDESFIHYTHYSRFFLSYIEKKLGRKLATFVSFDENKTFENIWGKISPFSKLINSRFHSLQMAKELKLFSPSEIVRDQTELSLYLKKFPCESYVIKDECSVSGRGTRILKEISGEGLTYPIRVEPLYRRTHDLGVSANFQNGKYEIKGYFHNKISESFAVLGGVFYKDIDLFFTINKLSNDLKNDFCEQVKKILDHYLNLGVEGDFQLDNFFYLDDLGQIQIYPLIEVNYRKTLASLLMPFDKYSYVEWAKVRLYSSLSYKNISEIDEEGIYIIGPEGQTNIDILICSNTFDQANELKRRLNTKALVDFIN